MTRKPKPPAPPDPPPPAAEPATGHGGVLVRDSSGNRHRFLRGMVTHDLVERGLPFDDAYAAARAVRDRLGEREEIDVAELKDVIDEQLEAMFGAEVVARLAAGSRRVPDLVVRAAGERQPFSRGLLARSVHAAGLDLDRAYLLVTELEGDLRRERVGAISSQDLARRMGDMIELREGAEAAARYRLVRSVHRLPRPMVLYLGGASGTGKSTLALEIAPLLRIYRITATDTIRQVMRMLFSPAILPVIHTSSFELPPAETAPSESWPAGPDDEVFHDRLTASFDEQATRVCVGVRAVVERALAENMSIIVEGVHLVPPLVPFRDLEGSIYQIALVLTTLGEETHRSRFVGRTRFQGRQAERYLENFAAIRLLQEHLMQQAEASEIPILDTTDGETSLPRALRMVTGKLEEKIPWLARAGALAPVPPVLLVVFDGMPDHPVRALGGRTPLQAARTPTLDRLAREGQVGLADPVAPGVVPDTASGSLAFFGQSPLSMKRGPVEAVGAGLDLAAGDVALRGNFATVDADGRVIDRRAGRIRAGAAELAEALDRLPLPGYPADGVEVRVRVSTEHRLAVVLKGEGLSSAILGSDPGETSPVGPPLTPRPVDPRDERAVRTARVLALFEQEARRVLATHPVNRRRKRQGLPVANAILTRGAGRIHQLLPLERAGLPVRVTCVSGDHTVLGLASWLGAKAVTSPKMTANLDTDLEGKFEAALLALSASDLVVLHLKGADIAGHDLRPDQKVAYLEAADVQLGRLLAEHRGPLRVAVTSDHATLSELGQHGADPVPVLIWGEGIEADRVECFDEQAVAAGTLQRFPLQLLIGRVLETP